MGKFIAGVILAVAVILLIALLFRGCDGVGCGGGTGSGGNGERQEATRVESPDEDEPESVDADMFEIVVVNGEYQLHGTKMELTSIVDSAEEWYAIHKEPISIRYEHAHSITADSLLNALRNRNIPIIELYE